MRLASSLHLLLALAFACLVRAQSPMWTLRGASPPPMDVGNDSMVYDMVRGRTVLVARDLVGGGMLGMNTWEWDGRRWWNIQPAVAPLQRSGTALVFDALRARTVLFGGGPGNDTWEWDGVAWLQRFPSTAPSSRQGHRMVFDLLRGRTLLFGGLPASGGVSDETWEWDGVSWTQRQPVTRPGARYVQGMAYDLLRDRIVMFGGRTLSVTDPLLADTWEWDGTNWTRMFPPHSPNAGSFALASDLLIGRTLLYAGATWTWDGSDWTQLLPATNYLPSGGPVGFAFDIGRHRGVLHGGAQTWEWDGSTWTQARTAPAARSSAAMAYADRRGSALLFGGRTIFSGVFTGVAWEWDGTSWSELTTGTGPGPRSQSAIAYDSRRDRYVLFGGSAQNLLGLGDTWELDRTSWIQRVTSPSPQPRGAHAMAFDAVRGRVVLFGGSAVNANLLGDTWEWDGTNWTQVVTAGPSPRAFSPMAFDVVRGQAVLFGGSGPNNSLLGDTWLWDGSSWQQRTPSTVPPARRGHIMTWDAVRGCTVVFGGEINGTNLFGDTWEWDGVNWTHATPAASPPARAYAAAAYDSQRGTHVVFGGRGTNQVDQGELWEYATPGFAIASTFGSGCGTPPLTANPAAGSRPILGATQTIDIANVPAGFAAMAYGFSMSALGAAPLPLDLGSLGMTGCNLLQSADSLFEACAGSGPSSATYSATVPNVPSLLSLRVWLQAWAPAPGQNAAGLIASNAVSLLLGSQ